MKPVPVSRSWVFNRRRGDQEGAVQESASDLLASCYETSSAQSFWLFNRRRGDQEGAFKKALLISWPPVMKPVRSLDAHDDPREVALTGPHAFIARLC
jgi:hypothetical protein